MFRPYGGLVVSFGLILWSVQPMASQSPKSQEALHKAAGRPARAELEALWTDLGSDDAVRAYRARWSLAATPDATVAFLKTKLRPAAMVDTGNVRQLIANLDSDEFRVREDAQAQLARLGEHAEAALRQALRDQPSAEARRRIEPLLKQMHGWSSESLQMLRGIEVLEHIATASTRPPLEVVARGPAGARLTREAKIALQRMTARSEAASKDRLTVREPPRFQAGTGLVFGLAFSADCTVLAVADEEKTIKLFDMATGQLRTTLRGHAERIWSVAIAGNGKTLASGSGEYRNPTDPGEVKLWDLPTGKQLAALPGHAGLVFCVAFASDGELLASGSWDETVKIWDVAARKERFTLRGHTGAIRSVVFIPATHRLVTGSFDGTIRLWDADTGKELMQFSAHKNGVQCLALAPDGRTIATSDRPHGVAGPGEVKLWELATGQERAALQGHTNRVLGLAFAPDGKSLAAGGGVFQQVGGEITLWDLAARQKRASLAGHKEWVECVAFTPTGRLLVSGGGYTRGQPGELRCWDVAKCLDLQPAK